MLSASFICGFSSRAILKKTIKIVESKNLNDFSSIDEYLIYTYGEKKLKNSMVNSSPTFLDVIGYTLEGRKRDGFNFETVENKMYSLEEIEELMNWRDKN